MERKSGIRVLALIVLTMALIPVAVSAARNRSRLIQSVDIQIPSPPVPVKISGQWHLVYELHLSNLAMGSVELTRVTVLDAEHNLSLGEFHDAGLDRALGHPGRPGSPASASRLIEGGAHAVLYVWLALDEATTVPAKLTHRIALQRVRGSVRDKLTISGGEIAVRSDALLVLSAPLRGGPWAAVYDPLMAGGHRVSIFTINGRARIPARFAIDWFKLDDDAKHARGDRSRLENWHGYDADVLAVADAVVVEAVDDMPDSAPAGTSEADMPLENTSGNYIVLDLGGGRYAYYEHLRPGSIGVKKRERVRSGQVLGRLGNSGGSSFGPHLHFHVADSKLELEAEGLPYVFRAFQVRGAFASVGAFVQGEHWKPTPAANGARAAELPAPNTVVVFQ